MEKLKRMLAKNGIDPEVLEKATEEQLQRLVVPYLKMVDREAASPLAR